jgi:hypothetical protein
MPKIFFLPRILTNFFKIKLIPPKNFKPTIITGKICIKSTLEAYKILTYGPSHINSNGSLRWLYWRPINLATATAQKIYDFPKETYRLFFFFYLIQLLGPTRIVCKCVVAGLSCEREFQSSVSFE